jgi:hypothetical protein
MLHWPVRMLNAILAVNPFPIKRVYAREEKVVGIENCSISNVSVGYVIKM